MNDTLLVQTFRSLNTAERREIRQWAEHPYFNRREDVRQLFEYLCEYVPFGKETSGEIPGKEVLMRRLVPSAGRFPADGKRPATDADVRYAMSFLFQLIKKYLAYTHWSQDAAETGRHWCQELRKRGLDQVFEKEITALQKRMDDFKGQNAGYFQQQYYLHMERWELLRRSNRSTSGALPEASASWDTCVAAETLRHACAVASAKPASEMAYSIYLQATLDALESGRWQPAPVVQAYYHCYRILSEKDAEAEPHFHWLETLLVDFDEQFPVHELRDLYVAAINFCIRKLNSGAREYIRRALDLYRAGLERGILLEDGFLNKYTYNNILLLALGLEEWDWALQFLEQYKGLLPPRDRESAWKYNLATYFFRKKDYLRAQEILRNVEFRDVLYNLEARRMLVRIYYHWKEVNSLESLLDSFTIYLQRKRASLGYHRDLNANFVRFTRRLIYLEPGDAGARERLRNKILAAPYVAEREWLLGELLSKL